MLILSITLLVIYQKVKIISMGEVMLKGFQCDRGNHKWLPRRDEVPKVCPR